MPKVVCYTWFLDEWTEVNMRSDKRGALLVTIVLVASAILGGIYGPTARATAAGATDLQSSVKNFAQVLTVVQQNYAIPVDSSKVVYDGAIPGMLRMLDPHSYFFDPHQWAITLEDEQGRYYGVGMQIVQRPSDNKTQVVSPFVGSPAYKAGIRPGDIILKVDDKSTAGMGSIDIADMLKGPKGTTVHISMGRDGVPDPIVFTLVRDEIPKHDVDPPIMIRPGVGYIRLTGFNETTGDDVAAALKQLNPSSLTGLVLDLRDNPGGVVQAALESAAYFLKPGQKLLSVKGRSIQGQDVDAPKTATPYAFPVAVLVNAKTASASEILAGALQDHDRAVILGEPSFGKGLVQNVFPLSSSTAVALTTAFYYTPSGRSIQKPLATGQLEVEKQKEQFKTDSGRVVTGGGGIQPDVDVQPDPPTRLRVALDASGVMTSFATEYTQKNKVNDRFEVTPSILEDFQVYASEHSIQPGVAGWAVERAWVQSRLKQEILNQALGVAKGDEVEVQRDPIVRAAVESLGVR